MGTLTCRWEQPCHISVQAADNEVAKEVKEAKEVNEPREAKEHKVDQRRCVPVPY